MDNRLKTIAKTDTELRVGNYMVLFGGRDLDGEHFTPETDFESRYTKTGRLYVDWEHGHGKRVDGEDAPGRDDVLGYVDWSTVKRDKSGLWGERILDRRLEYMELIETLIEEGLVGTSTEAAAGVEKGKDGEIKRWPLKRDALTVTPAEPRMMTENAIRALKSLAEVYPNMKALLKGVDGAEVEASADGGQKQTITVVQESKMSDEQKVELSLEQYTKLVKAGQAPPADKVEVTSAENAQDPAIKAIAEKQEELNTRLNDFLDQVATTPAAKGKWVAPDSEEDHADAKSFGDFLVSVRLGNRKRLKAVYGSTYIVDDDSGLPEHQKVALAESDGPTGGYLVPTEFSSAIVARAADFSVLRRAGATVVPMSSRSREVPALDIETAPSAGDTAFAGGAIAYWIAEAASITQSEPLFRMIELVAHKLATYSLASNEVRDDAQESVDGLLATVFARASGSKENYAFLRGDGVGKPLGILTSSALISATRSAGSAVALADLSQMMSDFMPDSWGRGAWFANPEVADQLIQLVTNPITFLETLRNPVPAQLLGMPLYWTGALPALNTAGDILLADPSYYLIGDRSPLRVDFSEHARFQNDQGAWRVIKRVDGQPWVNGTITLENASTVVSPFVALAAG